MCGCGCGLASSGWLLGGNSAGSAGSAGSAWCRLGGCLFPRRLAGEQVFQAWVAAGWAVKQIEKCLIVFAAGHEQALVEQGLLRSQAGAIEDEVCEGFMRSLCRAAQHRKLRFAGAQAKAGCARGRRYDSGADALAGFAQGSGGGLGFGERLFHNY